MSLMTRRRWSAGAWTLALALASAGGGCAKHSDFVDVRTDLTRLQDQNKKDRETLDRRLQAIESKLGTRPAADGSKEAEQLRAQIADLRAQLRDLESRLARVEGTAQAPSLRPAPLPGPVAREQRSTPPAEPEPPSLPGVTAITPTSAFNLAYNDYLNGRYDLAIGGFQRFLKDFPGNSLTPNAHYWIGESYYSTKDYGRAMQAFERVVNGFPRSEKVPPALFKMGLCAAELGDAMKAKALLRRVIEEFSGSDEAKLAKNKLAEIR